MKQDTPGTPADLRRRAEERLSKKQIDPIAQVSGQYTAEDTTRLLHELEVHQIEMEIQNEDLCRAQTALEEDHARYVDLYDLAPVGYVTVNEKGLILKANLTAATLLGMNCGALVNQPLARFIYKEDQDHYYLNGKTLFGTGTPQTYELRLVKADGTAFWAQLTAAAAEDPDGVPVCRMVLVDITRGKQTEEALKEKTRLLQAISDNIFDLVSLTDLDGNFKFVGASHIILGYDLDSLIGRNVLEFVHPDDLPEIVSVFRELTEQPDDNQRVEYRYRCADGSYLWFETVGRFLRDDSGNPIEIVFSTRDITQRKQDEKTLREKEAFTRAVMDHLPIGVAVNSVSPTVAFSYMNDNFPKIYRTTREALAAPDTFWDVVYEDPVFRETIKNRVAEDVASGDPRRMYWEDIPFTRNGEGPFYICARNIPLEGTQVMISTVWDVTDRNLAEAEREKLQAQLVQAQKMESVGRLAGGVAHDFNNMLGVILGHTEMALEQMDPAQPIFADLQEVSKAAERSADLTRQLLAFARKQTIAPKVIDLNETVEGMLKMLRRLIGEDITLLWKPGRNLRPIKVDPSQIDQILANLCVNARDAIGDVGKVAIETNAVAFDAAWCADHPGFVSGEYVMLAVSDNGCGMNQETRDRLFEPFFTTKALGRGTGLGLATVYGMVKQNNGFINVYSEPGQGTTIKVYLPRQVPKPVPRAEKTPDQPAAHGHETILLVEDEPAILKMTTMMLERLGYTVTPATTPGEAIRLAHAHAGRIDLLMTDVIMPEMNGRDLAGNLLSHYPDLKRLFMSGYTADVIAHHGVLDAGVCFIQKPFSMKDLAAKLREVLGGTSDQTQQ